VRRGRQGITSYPEGHLPVSGLRRHPQRVCPCKMQRLRPRIPPGILLQAASFLPFLPRVPFRVSEAGGGIRGVAVHGCPQESSSPAFCLQIRREKSSIRPTMGSQSRFPRLWNGSPCVRTFRTGVGRWCGIMASKTLLEASVQMVILTSITNRKPLIL